MEEDESGFDADLRTRPWIRKTVYWLGAAVALLHLGMNFTTWLSTHWQAAVHFSTLGALCMLQYPPIRRRGVAGSGTWLAFDLLFLLTVIGATIGLLASEDAIYERGTYMTGTEQWMAVIVIVGAIEFTRRTTGWVIPVLIVVSLSYVVSWGEWLNNLFRFSGLSLETLLFRSVFGDDALFGGIARISLSFVFMFILFGAFLLRSGAGEFVISTANLLAGRVVGGPGLVAVTASGLTGTISGSAVANTVSTGVVTIPLMKRAGFPARFAAGVEAAASTGGQLMPPIMGAGAFIMASYTLIPYGHIVVVAFLPALLYFLSVAFFVRIEARRRGLARVPGRPWPGLRTVMRDGGLVFVLPIAALIVLLSRGFTPTYAAGVAILVVIGSSWLTPRRMGPRAILDALALGSRNMIATGLLLLAVGLVVNVIAMTGVGNTLSLMIQEWSSGNLLLALLLVALASLVLGMGLPVTAAYIVLATLSAPALYDLMATIQLEHAIAAANPLPESVRAMLLLAAPGLVDSPTPPLDPAGARAVIASLRDLDPSLVTRLIEQMLDPVLLTGILLSAHMAIFWLSQDSNVTPPVCLTAFAAAGIAGTSQFRTGMTAWKLAKGLYIMPLLFVYTPFLYAGWYTALEIFLFSAAGLYAFAAAFQGHLYTDLNPTGRLLLIAVGAGLLCHTPAWLHWVALTPFVVLLLQNRRRAGSRAGMDSGATDRQDTNLHTAGGHAAQRTSPVPRDPPPP